MFFKIQKLVFYRKELENKEISNIKTKLKTNQNKSNNNNNN